MFNLAQKLANFWQGFPLANLLLSLSIISVSVFGIVNFEPTKIDRMSITSARFVYEVQTHSYRLFRLPEAQFEQFRGLRAVRGFRGRSFGMQRGRALRPMSRPPAVRAVPRGQIRQTNFTSQLSANNQKARRNLRTALGGKRGDGKHAHHVVPWVLRDHPIVQRAARDGFNINGKRNGILLSRETHMNPPGHREYTQRVRATLDGLWEATSEKKVKDWQYAQVLDNLAKREKRFLRQLPSGGRLD